MFQCVSTNVYMHKYTYITIYMHVFMYLYICIYMHTCTYEYIHICLTSVWGGCREKETESFPDLNFSTFKWYILESVSLENGPFNRCVYPVSPTQRQCECWDLGWERSSTYSPYYCCKPYNVSGAQTHPPPPSPPRSNLIAWWLHRDLVH